MSVTTPSVRSSQPPRPFTVALLGGGGIARAHLAAAKATQDHATRVEVVAVVDPSDAVRAAARDSGMRAYENVAALFDAQGGVIDGVIVCTPPAVRADLIGPAVEAGLAVLCEKPLARTLDEARSLVELAHKHDAADRCFVGYCHRFTPAMLEMRRRLAAGDLGHAVRFENTFACWHPTMQTRWMSDTPVSGGGSFLDTGCHSLDLFRFVLDEQPGEGEVLGVAFHDEWKGRGESNATVLLRAGGGGAGIIQSGWQEPERFTVTLVGTKGLLHYDYLKGHELKWQPSDAAFGEARTLAVESHDVRFTRQLQAFARRASGEAPEADDENLCSFAEGAEVARLVDEAVKRARA